MKIKSRRFAHPIVGWHAITTSQVNHLSPSSRIFKHLLSLHTSKRTDKPSPLLCFPISQTDCYNAQFPASLIFTKRIPTKVFLLRPESHEPTSWIISQQPLKKWSTIDPVLKTTK